LAIVLSVLLPYTDSDYPFDVFKKVLQDDIYINRLYVSTQGTFQSIMSFSSGFRFRK